MFRLTIGEVPEEKRPVETVSALCEIKNSLYRKLLFSAARWPKKNVPKTVVSSSNRTSDSESF